MEPTATWRSSRSRAEHVTVSGHDAIRRIGRCKSRRPVACLVLEIHCRLSRHIRVVEDAISPGITLPTMYLVIAGLLLGVSAPRAQQARPASGAIDGVVTDTSF